MEFIFPESTGVWAALGIGAPVLLYMIVEALKWSGFLKDGKTTRVAVIVIAAALATAGTLWAQFPVYQKAITAIISTIWGVVASTLLYAAKSGPGKMSEP